MQKIFLIAIFGVSIAVADDALYLDVKKQLQGRGDHIIQTVKRLGDKTVSLEAYVGADMDMKLAPGVLTQFSTYRNWLLEGLNQKPNGETYYIQFTDFIAPVGNPVQVAIYFNLELPLFKMKGVQHFEASAYWKGNAYVLSARSVRNPDSVIVSSDVDLNIFPADEPNRIWAYLKGTVKVRDWLLYAAVPERILKGEIGNRVSTMLKNYNKEESRVYQLIKSNQNPTGKREVSGQPSTGAIQK